MKSILEFLKLIGPIEKNYNFVVAIIHNHVVFPILVDRHIFFQFLTCKCSNELQKSKRTIYVLLREISQNNFA